jgi:hypothetical protein
LDVAEFPKGFYFLKQSSSGQVQRWIKE